MSKGLVPYICDACGQSRQSDANRWWVIRATANCCWTDKFTAASAEFDLAKHVCGEQCAIKLYQRWLATGSLEEK